MKLTRIALFSGLLALTVSSAWSDGAWNVSSGDWMNSNSWSPIGVPTGTITIDNSGAATLTNAAPGTSDLRVGNFGNGNSLTISGGGKVTNAGTAYLGLQSSSRSNTVTVTGTGSVLATTVSLNVGNNGSLNKLFITAGGLVSNGNVSAAIGAGSGSSNNLVVVDGEGSQWFTRGALTMGGSKNQLIITNGGTLRAPAAINVGAVSDDTLTVIGPGSSVIASGALAGQQGTNNQINVLGGATLTTSVNIGVGQSPTSTRNAFNVDGTGSVVTVVGAFIGIQGNSNSLTISNGGVLKNGGTALVGNTASAFSNTALVTGSGSVWSNALDLTVGNNGRGNQLIISNGASVIAAANLTMGANASSTNNAVRIDGNGSSLKVGGTYTINRGTNFQNGGSVTAANLSVTGPLGSYVLAGGTLSVTNNTFVNNGAAFVVGGGADNAAFLLGAGTHTFSNGLLVASNGLVTGNAKVSGNVTVGNGGVIAPGNSPGTLTETGSHTWQGGGHYQWEINDALGSAGTNSDLIAVNGPLGTLSITATALNPFVIDIKGLNPLNAAGVVTNFDNTANYAWTILTTSQGITGFDVAAFVLNTAGFTNFNALGSGFFGLVKNGNNLDLRFTGIPEPTSVVALLAGAGLALGRRRRKG